MPSLIDYSNPAVWDALYHLDAEPDVTDRPHVWLHYNRPTIATLAAEMAAACVDRLGWQPSQRIVIVGCGFGWVVETLRNGALPHARIEQVMTQSYPWANPAAVLDMLTNGGYTNVVGCDTSTFVQTNKGGTEEADINAAIVAAGHNPLIGSGAAIKARLFDGGPRARVTVLNEDGSTSQSRTRIRQALGLSGNQRPDVVMTEHVLEAWADADCQTISRACNLLGQRVQHFVMCVDPSRVLPEFQQGNWKPTVEQWKALLPGDTFITAGDYRVL